MAQVASSRANKPAMLDRTLSWPDSALSIAMSDSSESADDASTLRAIKEQVDTLDSLLDEFVPSPRHMDEDEDGLEEEMSTLAHSQDILRKELEEADHFLASSQSESSHFPEQRDVPIARVSQQMLQEETRDTPPMSHCPISLCSDVDFPPVLASAVCWQAGTLNDSSIDIASGTNMVEEIEVSQAAQHHVLDPVSVHPTAVQDQQADKSPLRAEEENAAKIQSKFLSPVVEKTLGISQKIANGESLTVEIPTFPLSYYHNPLHIAAFLATPATDTSESLLLSPDTFLDDHNFISPATQILLEEAGRQTPQDEDETGKSSRIHFDFCGTMCAEWAKPALDGEQFLCSPLSRAQHSRTKIRTRSLEITDSTESEASDETESVQFIRKNQLSTISEGNDANTDISSRNPEFSERSQNLSIGRDHTGALACEPEESNSNIIQEACQLPLPTSPSQGSECLARSESGAELITQNPSAPVLDSMLPIATDAPTVHLMLKADNSPSVPQSPNQGELVERDVSPTREDVANSRGKICTDATDDVTAEESSIQTPRKTTLSEFKVSTPSEYSLRRAYESLNYELQMIESLDLLSHDEDDDTNSPEKLLESLETRLETYRELDTLKTHLEQTRYSLSPRSQKSDRMSTVKSLDTGNDGPVGHPLESDMQLQPVEEATCIESVTRNLEFVEDNTPCINNGSSQTRQSLSPRSRKSDRKAPVEPFEPVIHDSAIYPGDRDEPLQFVKKEVNTESFMGKLNFFEDSADYTGFVEIVTNNESSDKEIALSPLSSMRSVTFDEMQMIKRIRSAGANDGAPMAGSGDKTHVETLLRESSDSFYFGTPHCSQHELEKILATSSSMPSKYPSMACAQENPTCFASSSTKTHHEQFPQLRTPLSNTSLSKWGSMPESDDGESIIQTLARIYTRSHIQRSKAARSQATLDIQQTASRIAEIADDSSSISSALHRIARRIQEGNLEPEDLMEDLSLQNTMSRIWEKMEDETNCKASTTLPPRVKNYDPHSTPGWNGWCGVSEAIEAVFRPRRSERKCSPTKQNMYIPEVPVSRSDLSTKVSRDSTYVESKPLGNIEVYMTCLSPRQPQLPLREELPSLGVELILHESAIQNIEQETEIMEHTHSYDDMDTEFGVTDEDLEAIEPTPLERKEMQEKLAQVKFRRAFKYPFMSLQSKDPKRVVSMPHQHEIPDRSLAIPELKSEDCTSITTQCQTQVSRGVGATRKYRCPWKRPDIPNVLSDQEPNFIENRDLGVQRAFSSDNVDISKRELPEPTGSQRQSNSSDKQSDSQHVLLCNERLLQSIVNFDYASYRAFVSENLTGIDSGNATQEVARKEFHLYHFRHARHRGSETQVAIEKPVVRFLTNDLAVISYIRVDHVTDVANRSAKRIETAETRIWERQSGNKWVNCHYHTSL